MDINIVLLHISDLATTARDGYHGVRCGYHAVKNGYYAVRCIPRHKMDINPVLLHISLRLEMDTTL